jgi:hypothetical protein
VYVLDSVTATGIYHMSSVEQENTVVGNSLHFYIDTSIPVYMLHCI